ncbi:MAG TPA: thioredoxin domain-containing protein, partial [Vicinamibacteria bacterium]|nr:thioredoxin domain-containing protein [Vicinamibacteria bacterium]
MSYKRPSIQRRGFNVTRGFVLSTVGTFVVLSLCQPGLASEKIAAIVNGQEILQSELEQGLQDYVERLKEEVYQHRQRKLDEILADRLIAREAASRGISKQQLLEREVHSKLTIEHGDYQKLYDQFAETLLGGEEQKRETIRQYVKYDSRLRSRQDFAGRLKKKYPVELFFPPDPSQKPTDRGSPTQAQTGDRIQTGGESPAARQASPPAQVEWPTEYPAVVAQIGDDRILDRDLEEALRVRLYRLRGAVYLQKKRRLEERVQQLLLKTAADERGLTVEALLQSQVYKKLAPVTDGEIHQYYVQNQETLRATEQEARDNIRGYLEFTRGHAARADYLEQLRATSEIEIFLQEPERQRTKFVDLEEYPSLGPGDAPVTIVQFNNYQCPVCTVIHPFLQRAMEAFPGKIRIVVRNYYEPFQAVAHLAAQAAQCARRQGRFWEYHQQLLENAQALTPQDLKIYAARIELDPATFNRCLDRGEAIPGLLHDIEDSLRYEAIEGPSLFVNGLPYADLGS